MKRIVLAVLVVFLTWTVLDFVVHEVVLPDVYAATRQLWRPESQINFWLLHGVVLVTAACFVFVYAWLVSDKSLKKGIRYGILYGIGSGVSVGYGSYSVVPLPSVIAFWWFIATFIQALIAGWLTGLILKEERKSKWLPFGIRERGDYIK